MITDKGQKISRDLIYGEDSWGGGGGGGGYCMDKKMMRLWIKVTVLSPHPSEQGCIELPKDAPYTLAYIQHTPLSAFHCQPGCGVVSVCIHMPWVQGCLHTSFVGEISRPPLQLCKPQLQVTFGPILIPRLPSDLSRSFG